MLTAKIIANGQSQAVRLPEECRFPDDETDVMVKKVGGGVYLFSKSAAKTLTARAFEMFPDDFMSEGRDQGVDVERESF